MDINRIVCVFVEAGKNLEICKSKQTKNKESKRRSDKSSFCTKQQHQQRNVKMCSISKKGSERVAGIENLLCFEIKFPNQNVEVKQSIQSNLHKSKAARSKPNFI